MIHTPKSDVAGRLGASQNVEPRCTRAVVAGALVVLFLEAARVGAFIQAGARAPSVGLTTQASSAIATARCIAATTMGTSWIAPLAPSHLGGVEASAGHRCFPISPIYHCLAEVMAASNMYSDTFLLGQSVIMGIGQET